MSARPLRTGGRVGSETEAERRSRIAWEADRIAEARADGGLVRSSDVRAWIDSLGHGSDQAAIERLKAIRRRMVPAEDHGGGRSVECSPACCNDPAAATPYLLPVTMNTPDCLTAPSFQSLHLVIPGRHPELVAAIKPRLEEAYGPAAEVVDHGPAVFYRWHPGKNENLSLLVDEGTETRPPLLSLLAVRLPDE